VPVALVVYVAVVDVDQFCDDRTSSPGLLGVNVPVLDGPAVLVVLKLLDVASTQPVFVITPWNSRTSTANPVCLLLLKETEIVSESERALMSVLVDAVKV
jgi:hypothetical protein